MLKHGQVGSVGRVAADVLERDAPAEVGHLAAVEGDRAFFGDRLGGASNDRFAGNVAEKVTAKLGGPDGGEYGRWLLDSVGALRVLNFDVINAIAGLGIPIATTNYDSLLTEVTGLEPICWTNAAAVEQFLRGDKAGILHIHGHWESPASVILGIKDYTAISSHPAAQQLFRSLLLVKTWLFIGCGDGTSDPNLGAVILR